jgi:TRAP-type C4-dicarboxylate transport system permease small subunit
MKIGKRSGNVLDYVFRLLFALAGIILIFDMLLVSFDVVMRYSPLPTVLWVVEIAEYSMVFIVFLGTAWVLKRGEHVRIDLLPNSLSPKTKATLDICLSILGALVFLTVSYYSVQLGWKAYLSGDRIYTMLEPPKAPFMFTIAAGTLMLSIQFIREAYKHMKARTG